VCVFFEVFIEISKISPQKRSFSSWLIYTPKKEHASIKY
jgi:hypothetical protein